MSRKLFCLTIIVVFTGAILVSTYMASAAPGKGSGRILEKKTFIHFKKGRARPDKPGKPGGGKKEDEGHYTYIAKGLRWKTTEPFVFNPENTQGLIGDFINDSLSAGMNEWETYGGDIFGELSVDNTAVYDPDKTDDKNTFTFGIYDGPYEGVIAVTGVWGYFNAPPPFREIVEVDVLFNVDNIAWGDADENQELMDLLNIATHEIGHCAGMGDLYQTEAIEETMYGYSGEGETKKRDLYKGDKAGIANLYQ